MRATEIMNNRTRVLDKKELSRIGSGNIKWTLKTVVLQSVSSKELSLLVAECCAWSKVCGYKKKKKKRETKS